MLYSKETQRQEFIKNGCTFAPRKSEVRMATLKSTWDDTCRSQEIHTLIQTASSQINTSSTLHNKLQVTKVTEGTPEQINSIRRFVQYNKLGSIDALVNFNKIGNEWKQAPVEIVTFTNHRISALVGQKGVVATEIIPKDSCICQYSGVEYTPAEWNKIYYGSDKYVKHLAYLCTAHFNNNKITIDAMELDDRQFGLYMNDYRNNIHKRVIFETEHSDWKYHNVDFCEVKVNNCPAIFMVANKQINVNDELCCFYGNKYTDILREISTIQDIEMYKKNKYNNLL